MTIQSLKEKGALWAVIGMSTFAGAAGGATLFNAIAAHAQATTPTVVTAQTAPAATASPQMDQGGTQNGTFKSNEDPTHEAKESAAREAQENAGQRPTVP